MKNRGTIYLLHFTARYHHAGHYVGFTTNLDERIADHLAGRGARLMEVIVGAGLSATLARTWQGTRITERRIKSTKNTPRYCPVCNPDSALRNGVSFAKH